MASMKAFTSVWDRLKSQLPVHFRSTSGPLPVHCRSTSDYTSSHIRPPYPKKRIWKCGNVGVEMKPMNSGGLTQLKSCVYKSSWRASDDADNICRWNVPYLDVDGVVSVDQLPTAMCNQFKMAATCFLLCKWDPPPPPPTHPPPTGVIYHPHGPVYNNFNWKKKN